MGTSDKERRHGKILSMVAQPSTRSPLIRWGPAVLIMSVIFSLSSIPSYSLPDFGSQDLLIKKLGHAAGYALLSGSIHWGLGRYNIKGIALAWLFSVLYAAGDELHQSFVPGRMASLVDVGIDAGGAFLGLLPSLYFCLRSPIRDSR
jgi:VanZ family protein